MIIVLWVFAVIGMACCLPAAALVCFAITRCLIVLGRRAAARLPRPVRKTDARHDALILGDDEQRTYAVIVARRKKTTPEPSWDERRQR